jgi:succinate dehydrogenase / fumarate reductase membrane anchor subunit
MKERLQTPLAKARGLGSAHEGVHHWTMQRLTAIAIVPLLFWFVSSFLGMQDWSYAGFTAWQGQPLHAVLMILAVLAVFYHAALGMQVVFEDYAHGAVKVVVLILNNLFFTAAGVACIFSVLKIAFGH